MRVLLADDQAQVRSALRLLLEQEPELTVVGEAGDSNQLLTVAQATSPELVLVDWSLPGMPAGDLLCTLPEACPNLRLIALSGRPEARRAALSAGVDAFVSKTDPPERLLAAVCICRSRSSEQESEKETTT